ncbi:MAG: hypothetical protein BRD27_05885 [Bacteroidetes bacterium QH_10_64_19]|nr:MAG: hypothetical protein BRD27_05885 [Bacteroidetes bacterium QH_10_64_19]
MSGRCRDLVQILEATPNDSRYANPPAAVTHRRRTLASTPAEYTGLSWRPSGDDLAALRARGSDDGNRLFFGVQERDSATTGPNGPGMKAPGTAKSGSTAADSTAGSSAEDYDPADVQVWHSSDVDIIPRQEVQAKQDRRDNYLAAWHLTASDTESP